MKLSSKLEHNDDCEQAIQLCTTTRAKKVVFGLTVVALIVQAINFICFGLYKIYTIQVNLIYIITFHAVVPLTVLIINAIVVREVRRRASSDAVSSLGLQHHQSTSSNSAVPTVMLVTTSLIYVLICGTWSIVHVVALTVQSSAVYSYYVISFPPMLSVYAYNFYVYLITGKQFRSELHKLCCCCRSSFSSSAAAAAAIAVANDDVQIARHHQGGTTV